MSDDERSDEKPGPHTPVWGEFKETDLGGVVKFESPSSGASYIAVFRSEAEARAAKDAPAMLELLRELEADGEGCCPVCGKLFPRTEEHIDEPSGIPCRLAALLDKHKDVK